MTLHGSLLKTVIRDYLDDVDWLILFLIYYQTFVNAIISDEGSLYAPPSIL